MFMARVLHASVRRWGGDWSKLAMYPVAGYAWGGDI